MNRPLLARPLFARPLFARPLFARLRETALLMVGQPSHAAYLRHMAEHHPDRPAMDAAAFFRDREQARYGGKGGGRCC